MQRDLSILIPSRNEMFLAKTVEDILENSSERTEVIVVLDGAWADPQLKQHERVKVIYHPVSIGQRAATNEACKLSTAKWVAKTDAHCSFKKGFDIELMNAMEGHDDWTIIPTMKNLHAFNWVCIGDNEVEDKLYHEHLDVKGCGHFQYQGPTPEACKQCGGKMVRQLVWKGKDSPNSRFFAFDSDLHFQYWGKLGERGGQDKDIAETMSIQGSFFMLTREKYWELDISSEKFNSWGQQGVEVACKTWLSGGKVMNCNKTWYAHMFRTQGGDFSFPYENPQSKVNDNRKITRNLFLENNWEGAKRPFSSLLDQFAPVQGWSDEDIANAKRYDQKDKLTKGIIYYTDNKCDETVMNKCQKQLIKASNGLPIVSISLKPMDFGDNIHLDLERGYLTMAKQILAGLEKIDTDIVFFCEHDVLYHESHFDITPVEDLYYYNTNVWRVRYSDGHALKTDNLRQLSGMSARRNVLVKHYRKRVELLENKLSEVGDGVEFRRYVRKMGFEPGTHGRNERVDEIGYKDWSSKVSNIDIRDHGTNLTPSRWSKDQFRNQRYTQGWTETDNIPHWGRFSEIFESI